MPPITGVIHSQKCTPTRTIVVNEEIITGVTNALLAAWGSQLSSNMTKWCEAETGTSPFQRYSRSLSAVVSLEDDCNALRDVLTSSLTSHFAAGLSEGVTPEAACSVLSDFSAEVAQEVTEAVVTYALAIRTALNPLPEAYYTALPLDGTHLVLYTMAWHESAPISGVATAIAALETPLKEHFSGGALKHACAVS